LTIAAIVIPTIFLILIQIWPNVLTSLQRDPDALATGQWWRLISPLLVDSDGWLQLLWVSVGFVAIGILAEHRLGWWRWLLLFLAGGLAGEITGYLWEPYGGGTSIALFGILGGLLVLWIRQNGPVQVIASIYALAVVPALACEAITSSLGASDIVGIIAVVVLCWLLVQVFLIMLRQHVSSGTIIYFIIGVDLLAAILLTIFHNHHGVAFLAGFCVGAILIWLTPKFNRSVHEA
jgi:membrane associated rhomboid family serine protease